MKISGMKYGLVLASLFISEPHVETKPKYNKYLSIAQLVEHRAFNPGVEGSNPSGQTMATVLLLHKAKTASYMLHNTNIYCLRMR